MTRGERMATNYEINYNDQRFTQVEADKNVALNDLEQTYSGMIDKSDKYYQDQIDASKQWADKQAQLQQEKTDFAIDKIEQQKAQAKKDYTKEQSGAYVDWQKQSNEYGANAEQMAAQGLAGSGYSESSQVSMYNTYQNRVMTARDAYLRAVQNYDNSITEARLQNNSLLAEIAYNALQQQLELSLQGFQYKNQLILDKTKQKLEVENMYYNRYQDVLEQINHENALAEQVRQFNENKAMEQAKLAEQKRQFDETMAWNKAKAASSSGGGGSYSVNKTSGSSGGSVSKKPTSNTKTTKERIESDNPAANSDKTVNTHGDSWVLIPGHGRFSWPEVFAYVQDGTIKETQTSNGVKYTWVEKTAKNVTPDAKGYAAKQYNLMHQIY